MAVVTTSAEGSDAPAPGQLVTVRNRIWVASDVVIEGMSLTHNYAQQFNALLRTRSFGELLEMMRGKLVQLRAENPS